MPNCWKNWIFENKSVERDFGAVGVLCYKLMFGGGSMRFYLKVYLHEYIKTKMLITVDIFRETHNSVYFYINIYICI